MNPHFIPHKNKVKVFKFCQTLYDATNHRKHCLLIILKHTFFTIKLRKWCS